MAALDGIRIVSIALNVPGPLAVARLREAGASIVKIEPPAGDPLQHYSADWYAELHRDTRVDRIDLKSRNGRAEMRARLADAQLFISSQRPSALTRLQLDTASLAADARTAHLRTLNIVGDRSQPEIAGHDLTYVAGSGLVGSDLPRTLMADIIGAEHAFSAALLLLREPEGTHSLVGLTDALAPLVAPLRHGVTRPGGALGGGLAAYGIYNTRAGRIAVAALEPHFRERLYRALDLPLDSALASAFLDRTAIEWDEWARERDIPICAVRN